MGPSKGHCYPKGSSFYLHLPDFRVHASFQSNQCQEDRARRDECVQGNLQQYAVCVDHHSHILNSSGHGAVWRQGRQVFPSLMEGECSLPLPRFTGAFGGSCYQIHSSRYVAMHLS